MILLTGGLYPQMVFAVIGGFACSVLAFVLILKFVIRRKFSTPEFKELDTSERIIRYVMLIITSGHIHSRILFLYRSFCLDCHRLRS